MAKDASQEVKLKAVDTTRRVWKEQEEREGRNPTGREVELVGTRIAEEHDREVSERKRR